MTPVSHQQHHGLPSSYMGTPVETGYGSRKRTHSNAEGLQTSPFLQGQSYALSDRGPSTGISPQWPRGASVTRPSDAAERYRSQTPQQTNTLNADNQTHASRPTIDRAVNESESARSNEHIMHPGDDEDEAAITL